ncbi:RluA family pseudouridine synthase [Rheinheimera sp.]|uniref:RluA family pseudouridine synthase n=1 Tax=Rheinheimera sp. TaxID=1869214 RepID=UPI00307DA482
MLLDYKPPLSPYLDILYQDDAILVLNKPSGLLTVPGKAPEHFDSLDYRVRRVWPHARIVHRLDMATSGLVVMAMHLDAQRHLNRQFQQRTTQKRYMAVLEGQIRTSQGAVELPLICDWPNRPKQKVCFEYGKPALTYFEVLEKNADSSRVLLKPVTGRSHQLRVHMQWLGHPILGDKFYASEQGYQKAERLLLHAFSLAFVHPVTANELYFEASCPF